MPDDYSSDLHTTGSVEVGGSVEGAIETRGDRDWFAVTLEAGKTYRIDMKGYHTVSASSGPPSSGVPDLRFTVSSEAGGDTSGR